MNIKLTDRKQIDDIVQTGKFVAIQDNDSRQFEIMSPFTVCGGDWRKSGWWSSREKCKKNIGEYGGYSDLQKEIDKNNWSIVETFSFIPEKAIEVGSLVRVREDAIEIYKKYTNNNYSTNWIKELIGGEYPVQRSDFQDIEIRNNYLPIQAVEPVLETPKDDELIAEAMIARLKEMGRIKDGSVIV